MTFTMPPHVPGRTRHETLRRAVERYLQAILYRYKASHGLLDKTFEEGEEVEHREVVGRLFKEALDQVKEVLPNYVIFLKWRTTPKLKIEEVSLKTEEVVKKGFTFNARAGS
jgi:hypothetical protein